MLYLLVFLTALCALCAYKWFHWRILALTLSHYLQGQNISLPNAQQLQAYSRLVLKHTFKRRR